MAAALCVTAAVTLTACGDDKKANAEVAGHSASAAPSPAKLFEGLSAAQIAGKSRLAMTKLKSFRVKGGRTSHGVEMTVDFTVAGKGSCQGTFTVAGAHTELRVVGGHRYMKGDKKFWQQSGRRKGSSPQETNALAEMFKGRWFAVPEQAAKEGDDFYACDFNAFEKDSPLHRGAETEVDGIPAVTLTGKEGSGGTRTILVSAKAEPYPLRVTVEGGTAPGSLEYSAFNEPVTVTPPPADEVLDFDKLKK
ncbi:hypothetical protein [Streptomyces sp. BK340]|uniref:hypothetical protein n=1 Tax=Streptomyces sp. BK340 TaxID=2572903 RepID=UPI00119D5B30|nr:hypothetical protein [Streptomyces sp. BK340]